MCRGLTRAFGSRLALDRLDLEVPTGSVFGFLGPNGAGKTTTVRLLLGILRPTGGEVRVLGLDPVRDGERVRAQCGVVLDQVGLYERLTAWQNLELAARIARIPPAERGRRVEAALRRVDLWDRRAERVSAYSKGMRQKLGVARALLAEPRLLILDEPTSGLDPENIVMLRELLLSLAQEGGRTIFLCTHLLDEAERLCDRVGILQAGRLRAVGSPTELAAGGRAAVRLRLSGAPEDLPGRLPLPDGARLAPAGEGEWRAELARAEDVEALVAALVGAGVGVRAVIPLGESLEEAYLRVVGGTEASRSAG
ncbi:MAG: ABC transporter ATP-binding protein [Firmicutes bacterium]|nr:ABC transporter ATP-binding protein [Bacillota bacterium]